MNKIKHFALTHFPTVYDEEAMSGLELVGRLAAKTNELIDAVEKNMLTLEEALEGINQEVSAQLEQAMHDGSLSRIVGDQVVRELNTTLAALEVRINNIVAASTQTDGNTELIDARAGYKNLGAAIRALISGDAFNDAVRPGTVQGGRVFGGMLGGDLAARNVCRYTIPMAGHWQGTTGYYNDALERVDHAGYNITHMFPCAYGDAFELESYIFGPLVKPAAVFNAAGVCIEVIGNPGESNWNVNKHTVIVSAKDAAFISFICGSGYVQQFRCVKLAAPQMEPPISGGYWRIRAKNRTNTVTDRAQIRCSFPFKPGDDMHHIPVQILKAENVKGVTVRLFGATSPTSYDQQLPQTAAGYTFDPFTGIMPYFTLADAADTTGVSYTHVCLFVDFIAENPDEYMDAWIAPPHLDGIIPGINPAIHGGVATDTISLVVPGAAGSPAYGKKLLGMGDSLMRGNTLPIGDSWLNLAAGALGMTFYNAGVNGSPVAPSADITAPDSMRARLAYSLEVLPAPDYFILTGGANDKRLNVPLDDYKTALEEIIDMVRAANPACKILLGTNWRRTTTTNGLGLTDPDYVVAMLEVAEEKSVHSFNNYSTGINLLDPAVAAWADEGIVSTGSPDYHFSKAANRQIADKYMQLISGL